MSDVIVHAEDLRKIYRLYTKPAYRFLDVFGLLKTNAGAYKEHAALDGISLDIRRGEKVGIIGRNGAGKSTLLRLLTGVIEPTSGVLQVNARAHALLQLGTGFHPDFTGRENVAAYFAQMGITGRDAEERCAEVTAFAEIEDYLDQPIKTYSSGMIVRLMFAASTSITPDLLVLDEVLGVGDAYFAQKSYTRIRELCDRRGTTLLLVSHDIYSASKICNRMLWIDAGRLMADVEPAEAVRLYENSIRLQEERRLRARALEAMQRSTPQAVDRDSLIVELGAREVPPSRPLYIHAIRLLVDSEPVASQLTGESPATGALLTEGTSWGEPTSWLGRSARAMEQHGSAFHKIALLFAGRELRAEVDAGRVSLEIEYAGGDPSGADVSVYIGGKGLALAILPAALDGWTTARLPVDPGAAAPRLTAAKTIGTGAIAVRAARLFDHEGREAFRLEHGRPARLEIDIEVVDPKFRGHAEVGVSIMRGGVETACRFHTGDLEFDGQQPARTVTLEIPENWLGRGTYTVGALFARHGYADQEAHQFYSISPDVFASVRELLEFEVSGGNLFAGGTPILAKGSWRVTERAPSAQT